LIVTSTTPNVIALAVPLADNWLLLLLLLLLLWQVSYQPEYYLGFQDHDQNYLAWQIFGEMFMNDTVVRYSAVCNCHRTPANCRMRPAHTRLQANTRSPSIHAQLC
jgi:hypothetical protein